jgi:hypothetical protein
LDGERLKIRNATLGRSREVRLTARTAIYMIVDMIK